ncbi:MAG: GTP-binding protein [Deltaproteobacteria bacterium]|jgi:sulfate adenylyltransferase large subunit|nr:GTP-binding protein [Deltaproteobacteria bacterium]
MNENTRENLKLVVTGHVDHGKSTVIGRLLYDTDALPQGTIDRVREISKETGQPFEFAFLLDAFEEERKQGITLDTTRLQFSTAKRDYLIIDAPGHKEFLKNMISGAADAEAAFLVVDAKSGVEEQTKRHAHMLSLLGIDRVGVLVNKMDLVGYDRAVFFAIQKELTSFLLNLDLVSGPFVPLSALLGENILKPSELMPWYSGPTLIGTLDSLEKITRPQAVRFPIQDVYKFDDRRIIAGRLESGSLKVGDKLLISPGGKKTTIVSFAAWLKKDELTLAHAGQSLGIIVEDEFFNKRGELITAIDGSPKVTDNFKASIFWLGRAPLLKGKKYKLKLATFSSEASIEKIYGLIQSENLAPVAGAAEVSFNEVAEVLIRSKTPLALDLFSEHKVTGRFVLMDGYEVAGGGIVTGITEGAMLLSGFVDGEIRARSEVFEEYVYSLERMLVTKKPGKCFLYHLGDSVPLEGESYNYPDSFDIVVFRDQVAIKIRSGVVSAITRLCDYLYEGFPMVNGRGFALKADSDAKWLELRQALIVPGSLDETELATKYLDFNTYRKISFG